MNYAGIDNKYTELDSSAILLQSIPYDGTSTWGKGADKAFKAFAEASENMELYDIETNSEVYKKGIHIFPEIKDFSSPQDMFKKVYSKTQKLLKYNKFLTFLGGEHSISIGIIKAFAEKYKNLNVLQLDAHADLRPEYLGTPYNHACSMHEANQNTNLVQVGIRSMSIEEKKFMNSENCFFAKDIHNNKKWMQKAVDLLDGIVYISLDVDFFDPSILPATGTPEPGGLFWYDTLEFIRMVFEQKNIVGFDICELAPIKNDKSSEFMIAKLYYKMLSYKFCKT